ncbi:hypothetical protein BJ912DRAFT_924827 [Pholiota molesta]|nr:hypothetical protein BJ912DRAFT_924827 [Pholiota molesta]
MSSPATGSNSRLSLGVVCRSPEDPKRLIIKRILAKEGDTVKTLPPYPDTEVVVPENHVWVEGVKSFRNPLGDEPFWTDDSNRFGPSPTGNQRKELWLKLAKKRFDVLE